ncbi:Vgb family protein [Actinomadura coerulea]|uniref:Vgb family protein n=1 Tax=Actinomadura coerulea TaxID=46159 RepID=UPI003413D9CC
MRHRRTRAGSLALAAVLGLSPLAAVPPASADGQVTEVALPVPDVAPVGLAAGPSGTLWYAANAGGIGRVGADGKVTEFKISENSQHQVGVPDAMTAASDGAPWFTDVSLGVPRVGRVNPATGAATLFELPVTGEVNFAGAQVNGIAPGPDGSVWITGGFSGTIGRVTPSGGVTAYATGLSPFAVTVGPDQAVWFTDTSGRIGRLDPATGQVTPYDTPFSFQGYPGMGDITSGPDGKLWFTQPGVGRIGSIDPATGEVAEYATPRPDSDPTGIVARDGRLWFTEAAASNIGSLDPATGEIAEYPLPATLSAPTRIVNGPGGHLWFTEPGRGLIGHFDPAAPPSGTSHPAVPASAPGTSPTPAARFQNQCAVESLCQTQVTTGGDVKIGTFRQSLPSGAIRITGALGAPDETGDFVLDPPVVGEQLISKQVEVPGGLIGQLPLIGPILGRSPAAMWDVNRLTISQTLAGKVHAYLTDTGLGVRVPLNVHLNNQLLGTTCVIGPITASLPTNFLAGAPNGDPHLGFVPAAVSLEAPIEVPAARGCGPFGMLDGVINQLMGLPSPASQNSMKLTGVLNLGNGINAGNTPQSLASGPVAARLKQIIKSGRTPRKTAKAPTPAPKKATYKVKARR